VLRIAGGIWSGDQCVFEWTDTLHGLAGVATCDWRQPRPRLDVVEGDAGTTAAQRLLEQLTTLLLPFHRGAFADVRDEDLARLYAGDYHATMHLAVDDANEAAFKRHLLDQVLRLGPPGKVLDAGCSAGEVVRQLRARGIDAHGFDLCPELDRIAYPEVAACLRQGSVDAIPFGPEHGFTTLLALDVFEHIPETRIPGMVREFVRLGVQRVVAHIALCEFQYPGHLTLRPLRWWDAQLSPWFQRRAPAAAATVAQHFDDDPSRYLRVYELCATPAAHGGSHRAQDSLLPA
jgi:hypothetical protein